MQGLAHEALTGRVIGAAIAVHEVLGPGFVEAIYENALALELEARGISFRRQLVAEVKFRGVAVGEHRLDLLVDGCVVVELKAIKALEDIHFAIVRSYLSATGREHGLLLNFSGLKLEARRVIARRRLNA